LIYFFSMMETNFFLDCTCIIEDHKGTRIYRHFTEIRDNDLWDHRLLSLFTVRDYGDRDIGLSTRPGRWLVIGQS